MKFFKELKRSYTNLVGSNPNVTNFESFRTSISVLLTQVHPPIKTKLQTSHPLQKAGTLNILFSNQTLCCGRNPSQSPFVRIVLHCVLGNRKPESYIIL